ncbi:hypothetical protein DFJ74DRAFT_740799 [Hyaloraphidium curvatum]|nr:hypothetical protein DFJ74DRAFT_740799 [Hyaloraphidium curvatum]
MAPDPSGPSAPHSLPLLPQNAPSSSAEVALDRELRRAWAALAGLGKAREARVRSFGRWHGGWELRPEREGRAEEELKRVREDAGRLGKAVHALERDRQGLMARLQEAESDLESTARRLAEAQAAEVERERVDLERARRLTDLEAAYADMRSDRDRLHAELLSSHLDLKARTATLRTAQHALDLARAEAGAAFREGRAERAQLEREGTLPPNATPCQINSTDRARTRKCGEQMLKRCVPKRMR